MQVAGFALFSSVINPADKLLKEQLVRFFKLEFTIQDGWIKLNNRNFSIESLIL